MPDSPSTQVAQQAGAGLVAVDGRTFPLESAEVRGRAGGGIAATVLVQQYRNPYAEPLEVLYTLPLPADGAVVGYTIRLGDRVIRGEVERRKEARARYRQALIEGRIAGLVEQERADTFTQTLGCLPPGVTVRVEIEVLQPLAFLPGDGSGTAGAARATGAPDVPQWEYRFPTVVSVRYEGEPGRVPDAATLDVHRADGDGTPVRVQFDLLVLDGAPGTIAPRSTSHELVVSTAQGSHDGATNVGLPTAARLDRDLVVRWRATSATVGVTLWLGTGLPGDDGRYGLLTVTPPAVPQATAPRDLTLLIDASGSMSGAPLETAKGVVRELLKTLAPDDRFEILAFASDVRRLTGGSSTVDAAEPNVHRALRELAGLQAGGATEMVSALHEALTPLRPGAQRQVVLLTDGQVGFEQHAVATILETLPDGCRLHTAGIGSAPNRTLTRGGARAGRGIELIVGNADDGAQAGRRLCRATVAPVLTDLRITGSAVGSVAPERPRDVFAGAPLVVAVELRPEGGTVEVTGTLAGQREPWVERIAVPARAAAESGGAAEGGSAAQPGSTGDSGGMDTSTALTAATAATLPVGALYGRERIEDCEMRLAAAPHGEAEPVLERIEALGLRHRIASRRTSLVAIAEEPSVDPREPRRRERLAVEMPAEVSAEGVGCMEQFSRHVLGGGGVRPRSLWPSISFADQLSCVGSPRSPERRIPGRILDLEDNRLVVEFEAPGGGLDVPSGTIEIHAQGAIVARGTIVAQQSTRPGRVEHGRTVRLVLAIDGTVEEWHEIVNDTTGARLRASSPELHWHDRRGEVVVTLERD